MIKRLVKHGNSLAIVLDKPILELLKITEDTLLEISTEDGKTLLVAPVTRSEALKSKMSRVNRKFGRTLKNLAK